jgi:endonuclease/exonuclease/phosphatase family metal-dependent hydrolase
VTAGEELRVLSYNVRSLRDDRRAVARVIAACTPHVVCVQEAPRFLFGRRRCRELARASGLAVVTGGRAAGAMLVLAGPDLTVVATRDVLLTKVRGLHQRGLAVAVVEALGGRVTVASMHLDLDAGERRRHAEEVLGQLAGFPDPLVLAGDVNETPGSPAWMTLAGRLQDAYAVAPTGPGETISAARPNRRIDAVFVDHRLRVISCGVPDLPELARASDHRPVLAVVSAAP